MAEDYAPQKREAIHTVLERQNPFVPQGSILTGWAVLAEWMTPDGRYSLTSISSQDLPPWRRDGMLQAGLSEDFADAYVVEDEDEGEEYDDGT